MEHIPTGSQDIPAGSRAFPGRQTPQNGAEFPGRREGRLREAKNQAWNSTMRRQHCGLGHASRQPLLESVPKKCPNLISPQEKGSKSPCGTDFNQQECPESGLFTALSPSAGAGSPGKPWGRDDAIPRHARTGRPSCAVY